MDKTQIIWPFFILEIGLVRTWNFTNERLVKCFWQFKDSAWTPKQKKSEKKYLGGPKMALF